MKTRGRPAIEITSSMLSEIERLASVGLNQAQIAEALNISTSTIKRNSELIAPSLKRGQSNLRERIATALIEKIEEGDTTALIFTAKRLNIFQPSIDATAPTTITEALAQMGNIYEAHALGKISETTADKLSALLDKFIRAIELTELEQRLILLEEKAL